MNTEASRDVFDAGSLGAYTEAYATDEMIDGVDPHPADDMYALGIIAYELLTGFHPYQRHSAPAARKLGLKPEPLKGLKRKEARAIERCLSFDRKQRPQNAGDFLKLFRGVTALQKATLAAAAVLALVAGYVSTRTMSRPAPRFRSASCRARCRRSSRSNMNEGNKFWAFFEREQQSGRRVRRIEFYGEAYDIHPRNREAVAGLKKAADALLATAGSRREETSGAREVPAEQERVLPEVRARRRRDPRVARCRSGFSPASARTRGGRSSCPPASGSQPARPNTSSRGAYVLSWDPSLYRVSRLRSES